MSLGPAGGSSVSLIDGAAHVGEPAGYAFTCQGLRRLGPYPAFPSELSLRGQSYLGLAPVLRCWQEVSARRVLLDERKPAPRRVAFLRFGSRRALWRSNMYVLRALLRSVVRVGQTRIKRSR